MKIIVLSIIKILEEGVVTSFKVVADQRIVKKIVKFLNSLTLNGWTNFIGTKVKINDQIENWVNISLANGNKGWVALKHLNEI